MTLSTMLIEREVSLDARGFGEPRPAGRFGYAVPKCDFRMVIRKGMMALSPVTSGMI